MTMIAYAFLQHRRLTSAKREKKSRRTSATADLARGASCHHRSDDPPITPAMPALPNLVQLGLMRCRRSAKVVLACRHDVLPIV